MEKKLLTREESENIAKRMLRSVKLKAEIEHSTTAQTCPKVDFYPDDEMYHSGNEIHIGYIGITEMFECGTEEEFHMATNFALGHEIQHHLSTNNKSYGWGIMRGKESVLEYIASVEDPGKRFRNDRDYAKYVEELGNKGIYVNWRVVENICAGIANSLEDGRIESIRSKKYPGFKKLRRHFRAMFWRQAEEEFRPYEDLNAAEKLRILTNEILLLSTTQLFSPGFFLTYSGTPLMDEINSFMPYIVKAITSPSCRGMAAQCIELCKALAPYMYEAFKMSRSTAEKELQKLIDEIIRRMIESNGDKPNIGGTSERNEEQGDGEMDSLFGQSDLVITIPDEEYDKLEEEGKLSEEGNIMVRREHPKESDEPEDPEGFEESEDGESLKVDEDDEELDKDEMSVSKRAESSENAFEDDECQENSSSSCGHEDDEGFDEEFDNEEGSSEKSDILSEMAKDAGGVSTGDDNKESEDFDSTDMDADMSTESSADSQPDNTDSETENSKEESDEPDDGKAPENVTGDKNAVMDAYKMVLEEAKAAAEESRENAAEMCETINVHDTHERKSTKEVEDREDPLNPEAVRNIVGDWGFVELKREYKVTDNLPPVLEARGRAMYRKNKRYFKSLSTPNVSHLDSGMVDPSLIYGLGMGDTEIFRKKGKDKKFDGCAYILIDNSGSMAGNKRIEACKAAAIIEEGFKGLIPIKITAFDVDDEIVHETVKGWEESLRKNCCWNFCLHGREGYGNEDGFDIEIATKELLARTETKKMLVILSDGAPGDPSHVKQAVQAARKKGIQVYSIYFEEGRIGSDADTFRGMYEKDYVICELQQLDDELSKLFKKFSRS